MWALSLTRRGVHLDPSAANEYDQDSEQLKETIPPKMRDPV